MSKIEKNEVLLSVKDISFSFGNNKILKDINFEIRNIVNTSFVGQGQVVALVGKSGIGKSCLLNILSGLLEPQKGTVLINQEQRPIKPGDMGVVFQDYYIYTWLTVEKIFKEAVIKNKKVHKKDRKDFIKQITEQFDLCDHINKFSYQLSGGQRQRVAMAEQLLHGGNFIFLDEPFSGLDVLMIDKVLGTLTKVSTSDELKTLIIISHDLENTMTIADTLFVLNKVNKDEGATIVKEIDLIERGLAYQKDIKDSPIFKKTFLELKELMK